MNTNETKTVGFKEYGGSLDLQIIKDGMRLYLFAKNYPNNNQDSMRDKAILLWDMLVNQEPIKPSDIYSIANDEVMDVAKVSEQHSGASMARVCWVAVNLARGYTIVGDFGNSEDLFDTVYEDAVFPIEREEEVIDPSAIKKFYFNINHGSNSVSEFIRDSVMYDNEYDAHVALVEALNEYHTDNWTANGNSEITTIEEAVAHLDNCKDNNEHYPYQYIFRDGCGGDFIAGYVSSEYVL